jgi:hypothetical protein
MSYDTGCVPELHAKSLFSCPIIQRECKSCLAETFNRKCIREARRGGCDFPARAFQSFLFISAARDIEAGRVG